MKTITIILKNSGKEIVFQAETFIYKHINNKISGYSFEGAPNAPFYLSIDEIAAILIREKI